jgi:ankyrin repeat protein
MIGGNVMWFDASAYCRGADVNSKDYQGWTPLHVAVQSGSIELVRELMALGAAVGARDREGNLPVDYTPVSRGLYHQNRDMQRLLRSEMEGSSRSQTPDNAADCGCVGGESAGSTPQSTPAPIHTTLLHNTPIG